jgi:hypothetical protein
MKPVEIVLRKKKAEKRENIGGGKHKYIYENVSPVQLLYAKDFQILGEGKCSPKEKEDGEWWRV